MSENQNEDKKILNSISDIENKIDSKFSSDSKVVPLNPKENEVINQTIFHIVEDYLSKRYELRFNKTLLNVEIKPKKSNSEWKICNENDLYIEMNKNNIKADQNKIKAILGSSFVKEHNLIKDYFKNIKKWDGTDYISELCKYISSPEIDQFEYHLKKWLVRSVKCMLIDGYFNKQAFVITDKGNGQDIGKSHFTKWICPPGLPSTRSFEDAKKDNLIKLSTNAFIILDELDGISRKDLNVLKSMFSTDETRVRLPYGKREETIQRIANFIGSTNDDTFLTDPTGSVRWLVFYVTAFNWDYSKNINIEDIWSQAYALSNDKNFVEKLTKSDLKNNEIRNEEYQLKSTEQELIESLFDIPNQKNLNRATFYTSTDVLKYIQSNLGYGNKLYAVSIGKAMTRLKNPKIKSKERGVYGYMLIHNNKSIS